MLSLAISLICIALECVVLAQGVRERLVRRYPIFYGYILFVAVQSPVRLVVRRWYEHPFYSPVYWVTEFLGLVAGSLIVLEIYRLALAGYPGTARMARRVLLFLFALAAAKAVAAVSRDPQLLQDSTGLQMERALRTVQAIALVALVSVFAAYAIPFGKNLRGILLGYGLFVGERVVCLTFVAERGTDFWYYAYSASYVVALGLWVSYLRSYQPVPEAAQDAPLEQDYQMIAATTRRRIREARGYLRKTAGS